jgi:hypothetical protein
LTIRYKEAYLLSIGDCFKRRNVTKIKKRNKGIHDSNRNIINREIKQGRMRLERHLVYIETHEMHTKF